MKLKIPGAIVTLASIIYFVAFHWNRFLSDFWPPDKATVAPNILASVIQYAMIGILAYVFYPPVRRAVDKWVENHLHKSQTELHAKIEALHAHVTSLHGKVDALSVPTLDRSPATPAPTPPDESKSAGPSSPAAPPH